ncbi:MAG: cytochrome C oxidase subunit IV family protein [Pseudomonadota bacterium]
MNKEKTLDLIWILLMAITIMNAMLAESSSSGAAVTILVAVSVGFKGHMVIDHFMGLKESNRYLRNSMNVYFYVIPTMMVIIYIFPETIAQWTSLSR